MAFGWAFKERDSEWGEPDSAATRNPLAGSKKSHSELLAREAIQNSVDAANGVGGKPRIVFRIENVKGKKADVFRQKLFRNVEMVARKDLPELADSNFSDLLKDRGTFSYLVVEDHGTSGAFGNPKQSGTHLSKLMLELGNPSKNTQAESTGGSFGYGKSVFLTSGQNNIFFAYTTFDPDQEKGKCWSRFLGVGYHNSHSLRRKHFSGKAVFGKLATGGNWTPIENYDADDLADDLGIGREKGDYGTTIIVPGPSIDPEELKAAIELWWWPKIVSHDLDVEIFVDGKAYSPPRPKSNKALKKYIEAFSLLQSGTAEGTRSDQDVIDLEFSNRKLGRLGLVLNLEETSDGDNDDQQLGEIAIMRRPMMVVDYHDVKGLSDTCKGVFIADSSVDELLRTSENPAHTDWDAKSDRIKNPADRKIVAEIPKLLGRKAREFSKKAQPPIESSGLRVPILDRMIGRLISLPSNPGGGTGAKAEPVSISDIRRQRRFVDGQLQAKGSFVLEFRPGTKDAEDGPPQIMKGVVVSVDCTPKQDSGESHQDQIPVRLQLAGMREFAEPGPATIDLVQDEPIRIDFESLPYSTEWTVTITPRVVTPPKSQKGTSGDAR